jgi:hypothetical protein
MYIVDNDIREISRMMVSRPGLLSRVLVGGKIDRQLLRIELSREIELHDSAVHSENNGLRPRNGKGGGPRGRQVSPSPWAREHPRWDQK